MEEKVQEMIDLGPDLIKKAPPEEVTFEMKSEDSRKYSLLKGCHTSRAADARSWGRRKRTAFRSRERPL